MYLKVEIFKSVWGCILSFCENYAREDKRGYTVYFKCLKVSINLTLPSVSYYYSNGPDSRLADCLVVVSSMEELVWMNYGFYLSVQAVR
jgi:hypothetical protein